MSRLPRILPLAILIASAIACGQAEPSSTPKPPTPIPSPTSIPTPTQPPIPTQPAIPDNTTWILESIGGNPTIENSFVMLKFEDDWITGYDGCNRYGGRSEEGTSITDPHGSLSFPPMAVTARDCPDPEGVTDQADAYITALTQGKTYRLTDDQLEILDSQGETTLLFTQQTQLQGRTIDLSGTAWRLLTDNDTNPATLAFLDHRLLTGDTACRSYIATYNTDDETIRFPSKSMLKRSQPCSDEERTLEGAFGDFQTWAREYAIHDEAGTSRLTIRSAEGETRTFEPLPPTIQNISDTEWDLVAIIALRPLEFGTWNTRTTHILEGTRVTLSFESELETIGGSSGCNSYGGSATAANGSISIDAQSLSSTLKLCGHTEGLMEQEQRYLDLLPNLTDYTIFGNNLAIQTNTDTFLLFHSR